MLQRAMGLGGSREEPRPSRKYELMKIKEGGRAGRWLVMRVWNRLSCDGLGIVLDGAVAR